MRKYWERFPPTNVLLAYVHTNPKMPSQSKGPVMTAADMAAMIKRAGGRLRG